jgi:urease accessory protein
MKETITMKIQITRAPVCLIALAAILMPGLVQAHVAHSDHASILAGLGHPFSGIDHILVMIAIGIWASQLGRRAVFALPVAFPLIMTLGAFLGVIGVPLPAVEAGIALSAIFLGAAVLLKSRADLRMAVPLVAIFGLFHGHAHGSELPLEQNALLFGAGFVAGTGLLHAVGIAFGLMRGWRWGRVALHGAGAAVLASGIAFLLGSIA